MVIFSHAPIKQSSLKCLLQHANTVMMVMVGLAILVAVVPLKFIFMATTTFYFTMTSKLGKYIANDKGNRRLKEWWDSIPVVPVEIED